jgi:Ca-activated chloride channel family protein
MDRAMVTRRALALVSAGVLVAITALWVLQPPGYAWADLWLTPDQQGRWQFERGDYLRAATHFRDPMWKGVACFRGYRHGRGRVQPG